MKISPAFQGQYNRRPYTAFRPRRDALAPQVEALATRALSIVKSVRPAPPAGTIVGVGWHPPLHYFPIAGASPLPVFWELRENGELVPDMDLWAAAVARLMAAQRN